MNAAPPSCVEERMTRLLLAFLVLTIPPQVYGAAPAAPVLFNGTCDASAAVAIDHDLFCVANDEDNVLRFYRRSQPGVPVQTFDLGPMLRVTRKSPESDLEGAARIGSLVYWITSHGRNATGKPAPNRHRLMATELVLRDGKVSVQGVGSPYTNLIADLSRDPRLARFGLAAAAGLAPKASGGFNLEALTDTPEGHLLMGFRNPIPNGRALIVPLLNPRDVLDGIPPKLGEPILLNLGGLGLRGMGSADKGYYLIAGPFDGAGTSKLYFWDGRSEQPQPVTEPTLPGLNPEGICFHDSDGRREFLVLSDDGTLAVGGKDCKKLPPAQRRFRAFSVAR